ncbi:hypothetical protein QO021_30355 (plasmid) [Pseudomonas amygdali pv. lachrymans]|uniref:hypothetical protein n=1 Tax=Pseudomonas amygdali TaxID=47877 RepID=UPI0011C39083|nr:hypothetical protein [Pseudomonas amygdali]WIO61391.1 hypothetical protein QO021_30355 [Pseudomonas amygdali pv. lachrymans]
MTLRQRAAAAKAGIWGLIGGVLLASGVIVSMHLMGAGASQQDFADWTSSYYIVSLGVCVAMLVVSKPARKQWGFMVIFILVAVMAVAIGFHDYDGGSGGQDPLAKIRAFALGVAMMTAKAVMYTTPGVVTIIYVVIAFTGFYHPSTRKIT